MRAAGGMQPPTEHASPETLAPPKRAAHGLTRRHVEFIALGGAVGAGLFLGSGAAIGSAGPGLLLAYGAAGIVIFLMARALGELALFDPARGSFSTYARNLLGPRAGFITGWSYWLVWTLVGIAEVTGIGLLVHEWAPGLPQWIPAVAAVALMYAVNMRAARSYGELEFWFSILKILTILALLIGGLVILCSPAAGSKASVANLWAHGGFLPCGWHGVLRALPPALFAFGGIEIIGLTAAETESPATTLPRAVNGVAYRILIFYIGSLAVIMMLYPWNALGSDGSPFVKVLQRIGLPTAARVIDLVAISAFLSSCNSGIFASSRMLQSLAASGNAPQWLRRLDNRQVPGRSVSACALVLFIGAGLNYLIPSRLLGYLMAAVSALLLWTWGTIMLCHLAYRRRVQCGQARVVAFRLPGAPVSNWIVLGFIAAVAVLLALDSQTRLVYYSAGGWFAVLLVAQAISARADSRR